MLSSVAIAELTGVPYHKVVSDIKRLNVTLYGKAHVDNLAAGVAVNQGECLEYHLPKAESVALVRNYPPEARNAVVKWWQNQEITSQMALPSFSPPGGMPFADVDLAAKVWANAADIWLLAWRGIYHRVNSPAFSLLKKRG